MPALCTLNPLIPTGAEAQAGGPAWDEEKLSRWGFEEGEPPALGRFAVELDQKFLTELAHTAAMFSELFEASGRPRLLKVLHSPSLRILKCQFDLGLAETGSARAWGGGGGGGPVKRGSHVYLTNFRVPYDQVHPLLPSVVVV